MVIIFFQSLKHVDFYLKLRFLIRSDYYIVPSPSTALAEVRDGPKTKANDLLPTLYIRTLDAARL